MFALSWANAFWLFNFFRAFKLSSSCLWAYFVCGAHVRIFYFLGRRLYLCVAGAGAALFLSGRDFLFVWRRRLTRPVIFFLTHGPKVARSLKKVPLSC